MTIHQFIKLVWQYYQQNQRALPWRPPALPLLPGNRLDPYAILVSEIMLQQTQVKRVVPKYTQFMTNFPTLADLAAAPLAHVLGAWSGLGYNRRAQYLWQTTKLLVDSNSEFPTSQEALQKLPGIGPNTAAAIMAYSYNQPVVFIETNIRSVFLHHFFTESDKVADSQLLPLIKQALDLKQPRQWYWALMDYGSYLKTIKPNPSRRSKHYSAQTPFTGSVRQLRGRIIKQLLVGPQSILQLNHALADPRLETVLVQLQAEGLINKQADRFNL